MYVLTAEGYEIVFSAEDLPSSWDKDYYELKKALIFASVPQWQIWLTLRCISFHQIRFYFGKK